MNPITISLGIPVYNQAATIAETVASALAQTEPFDEIVVVDNHSTDGTAERLQAYAGKIRIISPPNHLGMADNWNYCIESMNSKWFSLLSGDDLLKPGFVAGVKAAITAHSDAALIRTDWDVIDGLGNVSVVHHQLSVSCVTKPPKTWMEQLYGPKVSFAAFATRKNLWKEVDRFPTDFHLFMDWMFWLKLAPLGPFIRVPESLAKYRVTERPTIDIQRVSQRVADEHRYLLQVLPALPWVGRDNKRKVQKVRRHKLRQLLNYLAMYPTETTSEDTRVRLQELAETCEMEKTLRAWLVQSRTLRPSLSEQALAAIKDFARRFAHLRAKIHQ